MILGVIVRLHAGPEYKVKLLYSSERNKFHFEQYIEE